MRFINKVEEINKEIINFQFSLWDSACLPFKLWPKLELSILFMRFAKLIIARDMEKLDFQFSLWDSVNESETTDQQPVIFQFSLWDSTRQR